ncbi:MAG: hypothetical protein GY756_02325 [bacterium]|nr:hypothetical protein [bacterium]
MITLCIGKDETNYLEKILNKELSRQYNLIDNIKAHGILRQLLAKKPE